VVDQDKTIGELVRDIEAVEAANWDNPARVVPPFAKLLVRLSRDASETADKMVRLTNRLLWLTILLSLLTAIILAISVAQLLVAQSSGGQDKPQAATSAPTVIPAQPAQNDQKPANQGAPNNERR
jgi:hypothetical protein